MVTGGSRLSGEVAVAGAKNSVLKLMAASLLAEGTTTITNCPDILDVPVVFLTAGIVDSDVERLRTLPVSGVLHKPFNTEARLQAGFDIEELESLLAAAD